MGIHVPVTSPFTGRRLTSCTCLNLFRCIYVKIHFSYHHLSPTHTGGQSSGLPKFTEEGGTNDIKQLEEKMKFYHKGKLVNPKSFDTNDIKRKLFNMGVFRNSEMSDLVLETSD